MSFQVTNAFVQQYQDNMYMLSQQRGSRLRDAVMVQEGVVGESVLFDQFGSSEAQEITNRHGDSPLNSTPHDKRKASMRDFDWGDLVDKLDQAKTLNDPSNKYVMAGSAAMGRKIDDVIIGEVFGTAYTGKTGSTAVTFPSSQQVAVNSWAYGTGSGNAGLTISKLIEAKVILDGNETGDTSPEDDPFYFAASAKQLGNLLATTEVTNSNYNTVKALVQGEIDTFMGFKFIRTERLKTDGSAYRRCIAWRKSGIALAIGADVMAEIAPRADKRFSTYVYFCMSLAAARMEEKKVVEVKCLE